MTDDLELFTSWRAGDRAAGSALIERHFDALARFFGSKVGATHQDDLVQRTFLACIEGAAGFRGDSSFRAFLFGIARNLVFEHYRSRVRDGRNDPDFTTGALVDLAPGLVTAAAARAAQARLAIALERIPLEAQILVELYYWEELSVEELAAVLAVPAGTIKSRLHRARTLLREAAEALDRGGGGGASAGQELDQWLARVAVARGSLAE